VTPIDRLSPRGPAALLGNPIAKPTAAPQGKAGFAKVLREQLGQSEPVHFSAHAQQRLDSRAIRLTPDDNARIAQALDQAAAKGARESLLLMDKVALVVSVPNRTVITALGPDESANTVFTNIDSAVVVPGAPATPPQENLNGPDPFRGSPRVADRLTQRASIKE